MDGGGNLPLPGLLCAHCKKPWNDSNFYDTVVYHDTETCSLMEFVGETLGAVKFVYAKRNDAIYRTQPDILIRNDKYIDPSPKYPDPKHDRERGIVKNEHGWLSAEDGIADAHAIEEGDELFLNVWRYFHGACNKERLLQETEARFRALFVKAGFKMVSMMDLPNEYCQCGVSAPWFSVITEFGTIKIGWRKRVINIDWSGLDPKHRKRDTLSLFDGEDVTKGDDSIHAWGWEKAEDYLRRIREHLSA